MAPRAAIGGLGVTGAGVALHGAALLSNTRNHPAGLLAFRTTRITSFPIRASNCVSVIGTTRVVPMTLTQFDARIGKLVMRVVRKANSPAGWFRVFDNKAAP